MIVNTIDGSSAGGANQNQDLIQLIAPATEIMVIRGSMAADQKASDDAIRLAGEKSSESIAKAKAAAAQIIQDAQDKADVLLVEAKAINATAKADKAVLAKAIADATSATTKADSAIASANAKTTKLDAAIQAANDEMTSCAELKAEIITKHQVFISGL